MRHEAGFVVDQKTAEHFVRAAAHAGLDQKPREVRARDQLRVADEFQRAFVGTFDADLGQACSHLASSPLAAPACALQPVGERGVARIEAEPDDVHGVSMNVTEISTPVR